MLRAETGPPDDAAALRRRNNPRRIRPGMHEPRIGTLLPLLIGFVALGGPLVLVIWHELSELLMGRIRPLPLAGAGVLLVLFLWLAAGLGQRLQRISSNQ
jgi:hypothetical protein